MAKGVASYWRGRLVPSHVAEGGTELEVWLVAIGGEGLKV